MTEPRFTVPRRPLGELGESVSAVSMGLGPIARASTPPALEPLLDLALECGITSVDAAQAGSRILSEELLGRAMGSRRDKLFIATRSTPLDGSGGALASRAAARLRRFDVRASAVRQQLEESLRLLRTDRIDLYYAHDVEASAPRTLLKQTLPELVEARERGDVRYIGASGDSLDVLLDILREFPVDAILSYARLDLANVDLLHELLPEAQERGVAVINAAPLHMGLLGDERVARTAQEQGEHGGDDPLLVAALEAFQIARDAGFDLPELALRFAASEPRVATTVVGCASRAEIETAARAFGEETSADAAGAIADLRSLFESVSPG